MQKFLLKKSKMEMALQFLDQNSDIKVGPKVLLRDWPQNFKTPSNRDLLRNVCPVHANFCHLLAALHAHGVARNLVLSCSGAAFLVMCSSVNKDPMDPLSWSYSCAMGECP